MGAYNSVVVLLLSCCMVSEVFGCLEDEKIALLKLKDVFKHENVSVPKSWSTDDCCRWEMVTCDLFSNRIINLSFSLPPSEWNFEEIHGWYYLDTSLFQTFEELRNLTFHNGIRLQGLHGPLKLPKLQVLDLSRNKILYDIPPVGELPSLRYLDFSRNAISYVPLLGELPSLTYLDLSSNAISYVPPLGKLSSLTYLDLSFNAISHVPQLEELHSLKYLDLSFNGISTNEFTNFTSLELLKLDNNNLDKIPPSIWALTSLKMLGLSSNGLNGSLPKGFCALKNLQELDFSRNNFEGVIPTCFSNLTSLRLLDLSQNKFNGSIPSNILSSLKSLKYVFLSNNHFDGLFSFNSFANNSKLEVFHLQNLNPKLKIDTENTNLKHSILQLKELILSNCRVIPSFLLSQYDLRVVDLSNNGITGELPFWLLANNSKLEFLSLRNNSFNGRLTLELDSYNAHLISLDISMNQVAGNIPTFIGSIFPNLTNLIMSTNAIEGSIPSSVENLSKLFSLDLSNNHLSGELPGGLLTRCEQLTFLKLSNNNLEGSFLLKNMSIISPLQYFYLGSNNFSGDLTHGSLEIAHIFLEILSIFDISNNSFSGRFPDWISKHSDLSILDMSKNQFEGKLPASFCNLSKLSFLDLSSNNFSGTLHLCTNFSMLEFLHLKDNKFHGQLPTFLSRSFSMVTLDVRDNNFSGLIPSWIGSLQGLFFLFLRGNFFHGSIPSKLCLLENLNILDLAANNLSGNVPSCLSNIPFGKSKLFNKAYFIIEETVGTPRSYLYENQLHIIQDGGSIEMTSYTQEEFQFITKSVSELYQGSILSFISGIDLSLNKLTGPIPFNIVNWDMVHSLNLSHNYFNESIPWTLSRLRNLESLDLSYNMLSGKIPSQITDLNFLTKFSLAYNNLAGPTPTMTQQFQLFDASSYEGNPLLCGLPLNRSCSKPPPQHANPSTEQEQNDSFKTTFMWSFFGSFGVSCIGAFVFFYFNTNVPNIFLGWIGVEMVICKRTVELPWNWNK